MSEFKINTVLVTGSNRGLGFEFVQQFVNRENPPETIFATCRDPEGARSQELKKLSEKHGNVIVIQLDATDSASINAAVKQVEKHLNGKNLDLLINNAGVLNPQSLETQTAEDMLQVYNINVVGPMLVTQAFHHLLKRPGEESKAKSAIVHISALLGSMQEVPKLFSHFPVISYRCSKAALNMLSCCHAVGYKQDGILSIAIHPGWVQTDMGGSQAPLTKEESVGEMMKIISSLNETQSGTFVDHTGKLIPW
uniref:C-factor-like n=1 Tax=Leptobrachium leishanense TaxID=445787 RepID=A0A8C5MR73_9ANUR